MIKIDINKAKEICHEKRRATREEEFKPLDVKATIPMFAETAEAERQAIREKYDAIQTDIEAAATAEELKTILETNKLI